MPAPILAKPILPILDRSEVMYLIDSAETNRDKAVIALFVESGLMVSVAPLCLTVLLHANVTFVIYSIAIVG